MNLQTARHASVCLVVAPFAPDRMPALGVSSLAAVLRERGISTDVAYLSLDCRTRMGGELYDYAADRIPSALLGEVLFGAALWGDQAPPWETYAQRLHAELRRGMCFPGTGERQRRAWWGIDSELSARSEALAAFRAQCPALIRQWADRIVAGRPHVVGFSSTFQQNIASLALTRELRRRADARGLFVLFGGANCEGEMGVALAESFPEIDCVVSGEAEDVIADLVARALEECDERRPPRVISGRFVRDLDALPLPDFSDYFRAAEAANLAPGAFLTAESSRGCWWGERFHCTFCGLNGKGLAYRRKSPDRFASEARQLVRAHGKRAFMMADNIMDLVGIDAVTAALAAEDDEFIFAFETKSNVTKKQLVKMAAAGVRLIQPGIESLSSPVLQLMRKGTTRLQNLQLLKWCRELELEAKWNVIYGFRGESTEMYEEVSALIPSIHHLRPPGAVTKVRIDRFSPLWEKPASHGLRCVRPHWAVDFAYSGLDQARRSRVAYFFEEQGDGVPEANHAIGAMIERTHEWREAFARGAKLELVPLAKGMAVIDTRRSFPGMTQRVTDSEQLLLALFDRARSRVSAFDEAAARGLPSGETENTLSRFLDRGWIVREGERLLSVVVNPSEKEQVADLKARLRLQSLGLTPPVSDPA